MKRTELEMDCMERARYRTLREQELKEAFTRPIYQYTSLENATISRLHEDDYMKWRTIYD